MMPKYGHRIRHHGHMGSMLDADWLPKILLRSDWLCPAIASYTTNVHCSCKQSTKLFEKNPLFSIKQPNLAI